MSSYNCYYVEWYDATDLSNAWTPKSEGDKLINGVNSTVMEVGYLIKETDKDLVLASSVILAKDPTNEDMYGHLIRIPKAMILKKKKIKL